MSADPEIDLLNRLATLFPTDIHKVVEESWVNLSHDYVEHPETIGSTRGATGPGFSWPGQSCLGFLNQSRKARGLPVIVMTTERVANPNRKYQITFAAQTKPLSEEAPAHSDEKILGSDATLGEFYKVVEPVMEFLNQHFDPHTRVIIDTTNAEILSGLATHHTMKFVKD